ncbi:MAG: hypothetical protein RMK20_17075, partial [Verrucomicrobiales bacterium]|nr:hypothetical protein [Verrucomicrobiales bacterium]
MNNNCAQGLRLLLGAVLGFGLPVAASAQSVGDFRTVQSGDWASINTWERFNGTTWVTGFYPTNAAAGVVT